MFVEVLFWLLEFEDRLTMVDLESHLGMGSEALDVERKKFISWVNFVLRSLQCRTIEGLRICFDVVSDDIANWINFAIERRVKKLELDFTEVELDSTEFQFEPSSGFVRTVKDHPYVSLRDLSIREVELIGFMGLSTDTEFFTCLTENAEQLDKVIAYATLFATCCQEEPEISCMKSRLHASMQCPFSQAIRSDNNHVKERVLVYVVFLSLTLR
ncbi:hypothetical protein WN944_015899 [Citrus x changshan-huyou]|uniref:FBD domain-containing protein n=1 Tax=Citrus x changshan-huyou TaxID=2935761 RepID=A0AAP0M8D2_9ROSI